MKPNTCECAKLVQPPCRFCRARELLAEELQAGRECAEHLRSMTEWCKHEGDNDACTSCELVANYDEAVEAE